MAADDDADDSSSVFPLLVDESPVNPPSTTSLLREFREQWQHELKADGSRKEQVVPSNCNTAAASASPVATLSDEDRASALFNQGTELEQLGKVFEAMHLYRRAIQLVPDIEQRIYDNTQKQLKEEISLKRSIEFA